MSKIFEALKRSTDTAAIADLIEERPQDGEYLAQRPTPFRINTWSVDPPTARNGNRKREPVLNDTTPAKRVYGGNGIVSSESLADEPATESSLNSLATVSVGDASFSVANLEDLAIDCRVFPFLTDLQAPVAEQYRILRTNLIQHVAQPKVIAISSAAVGDGKTLTAINMSGILAIKSDVQVLLIDADMRRCSIAATLGLRNHLGFADVLRGTCTWEKAIVKLNKPGNLHILTAGETINNPAELLDSDACRSLIATLRKRFSFIIFDTTPISILADFKLVLNISDGAVIVVRPDHTGRADFLNCLNIDPPQKLLGTVINAYSDWFLWKTPQASYYYAGHVPKRRRLLDYFRRGRY